MLPAQLNTAVAAHTNINKLSLHTGDPGNIGDNDAGYAKQTLTWSAPSAGWMKATVTFEDVEGVITHVGLWDDSVFVEKRSFNVTLPSPQTLVVLVELRAKVSDS